MTWQKLAARRALEAWSISAVVVAFLFALNAYLLSIQGVLIVVASIALVLHVSHVAHGEKYEDEE